MKKLILISLAAFAMAGCAKESVVDSDLTKDGNKIGFTSYSNITRGNPFDNNPEFMADGNSFGVTAFISTSTAPYMGGATAGAQITSDGTKWDYANPSDTRFWPTNGETLSFYAYAPFTDANRIAPSYTKTGGMIFTDYTVPTAEANQNDFMYASALDVSKATPAAAVPLIFHHALTQVRFSIRAIASNMFIDVEANGVRLNNIYSKNTFTLGADAAAAWGTTPATPVAYTVTSDAITIEGTTAKPLCEDTNALMLLPQEFAAWDKQEELVSTTDAYLSINCKLYYKNQDGTIQYLQGNADDYVTINVPFSSQDANGNEIWKMRNKITYTLVVSGEHAGLEPIEFETTVDDWEDWNPTSGGDIDC